MASSSFSFPLASFNADLILSVIKFLSVRDSCHLSMQSQRFYYLVHQYRNLRGPELSVASGDEESECVFRQAIENLQSPPQLALYLSTDGNLPIVDLPPSTTILGCRAPDIQTIGCHPADGCESDNVSDACEYESERSVMLLAGLPHETTKIQPFYWRQGGSSLFLEQFSDDFDWKTFILFPSGHIPEDLLEVMQQRFPEALVVGGFCSSSFVTNPDTPEQLANLSKKQLRERYHRIVGTSADRLSNKDIIEILGSSDFVGPRIRRAPLCGVALAGDIPFHAVVSRGLQPVAPERDLVVRESQFLPAVGRIPHRSSRITNCAHHIITSIEDRSSNTVYSPSSFAAHHTDTQYIGVKQPDEDGYEVHAAYLEAAFVTETLVYESADPRSITGCSLDLFKMTGPSLCADVCDCMGRLKGSLDGQTILGALMISCNGRGPTDQSILEEEMADARRFAQAFPAVPCIGFYAGGEIGPQARARKLNPFTTGNACVQGFTAVFGVFIVPERGPESEKFELFV